MEVAVVTIGKNETEMVIESTDDLEKVKQLCRSTVWAYNSESGLEPKIWLEDIELVTRCRMSYSCNAFSLRWKRIQEA